MMYISVYYKVAKWHLKPRRMKATVTKLGQEFPFPCQKIEKQICQLSELFLKCGACCLIIDDHSLLQFGPRQMFTRPVVYLLIGALLLSTAFAEEEDTRQSEYNSRVENFEKWYKGTFQWSTHGSFTIITTTRVLFYRLRTSLWG